jgi:hypothetical protein
MSLPPKAALYDTVADIDPPRAVVDQRQRLANTILRLAAARHGAQVIDPTAEFCDQERCRVQSGGVPLYADADHLTRAAAEGLSHLFDALFLSGKRSVE